MQFAIDTASGSMNLAAVNPKDAALFLRLPEEVTLRREATYEGDRLIKLCYKSVVVEVVTPPPAPIVELETEDEIETEDETEEE